uniref:Uncharacterized protein n=1 Tax=Anopheles atroparvus TaxID=41427 RepID=A0A182IK91_ANOAO
MLLKAINPIGAFFQTCKVLWHLDAFRRSFRQLQGHDCGGLDCIFCALKSEEIKCPNLSPPPTGSDYDRNSWKAEQASPKSIYCVPSRCNRCQALKVMNTSYSEVPK